MTRHRPTIKTGTGHVGVVYRMRCTCGASGDDQPVRSLAKRDIDNHLRTLPLVPVEQQCRDPRAHGTREWEPCETCANQLPLFDLGDVA